MGCLHIASIYLNKHGRNNWMQFNFEVALRIINKLILVSGFTHRSVRGPSQANDWNSLTGVHLCSLPDCTILAHPCIHTDLRHSLECCRIRSASSLIQNHRPLAFSIIKKMNTMSSNQAINGCVAWWYNSLQAYVKISHLYYWRRIGYGEWGNVLVQTMQTWLLPIKDGGGAWHQF